LELRVSFRGAKIKNDIKAFLRFNFWTFFSLIILIFHFSSGLDDQNCYRAVERYDIQENLWVQVADMTTPRGGVAVAAYGL